VGKRVAFQNKVDDKDRRPSAGSGRHELLRDSFLSPVNIRELRDLIRRRSHMQSDPNPVVNRIGHLLGTASFKLVRRRQISWAGQGG
jgi:hypothetical protein